MSHKLRPLLLVLSAAALTAALDATPLFSSGPPTGLASNRPSYSNCTQCHAGTVNSSNATLAISGLPAVYTPGSTYSITVSLAQGTAMRWGFELAAQKKNGAQAGSFTVTDPVETMLLTGSGGVQYMMHTSVGTASGTGGGHSWTMDWTAPSAGAGKVILAASGNAANNNFTNSGDKIVNTCVSSEEDDGSVPEALIALQPSTIYPARSTVWSVPLRVTNTQAGAQNLYVVTRVKLPNNSYYPSTGWLFGPAAVNVGAGATASVAMNQTIPSNAPLITATLEAYVGTPAAGAMDSDTVVFTIQP